MGESVPEHPLESRTPPARDWKFITLGDRQASIRAKTAS
jgi:hypothetical protein